MKNLIKEKMKIALYQSGIFSREGPPAWLEGAAKDLIRELKRVGLEIKLHHEKGRPRDLDYTKVSKLTKQGFSLREIAAKLNVTHGAVAYALKKGKGK